MAVNSESKRSQSIPVRVQRDAQPAPIILPPQPSVDSKHVRPAVVPLSKKIDTRAATPIKHWPEEQRRKMMWWIVLGGTAVIVIGWLAIVRFELKGGRGANPFSYAFSLLKNVRWPKLPQSSAAKQEIQQYDQQVFPQFQK